MTERPSSGLQATQGEHVLTISRLFDAPRALVFAAFVDPAHAIHWLGPSGYAMSHLEADVRPGGAWRGCMRAIDTGVELWHGGIYRDIVPDERIVFTFKWDSAALGPETLVTVLFEDRGRQTLMRFTQGVFNTAENCEGHRAGWESEFDQLFDYVGRRAPML
jgi:uncharacterized protein YndB with AHSA1/START domain